MFLERAGAGPTPRLGSVARCYRRSVPSVEPEGLIFDLGLHRGEDTEFYLAKGFRVVAVEANPDLCVEVSTRLRRHIESKALTVVNRAIAAEPGTVTFYQDEFSAWSTLDPEWAARNRRLGSVQHTRTVESVTIEELIADFGTPYYMKVDVEGMDMVAVRGLSRTAERPRYISLESDKTSFRSLREEFKVLTAMGYDAFKVVSQVRVPRQQLPNPALEGRFVEHSFELGSSGAFGAEAPGEWLTAEEAIERYRRVFLQYALTGDDPFITSRVLRKALRGVGFGKDWFDTHARYKP